jgi:hypothetical protein
VSAPQATDEEREKYRYPQGRPRFAPGQDRPVQPTAHTTQQPGTFDAEGLWTPAAKPQLMDQLPSHPKAPVPR